VLTTTRYLVDTSAIIQLTHSRVEATLSPLIENDEVATCALVDLELFSRVHDRAELAEVQTLWTASVRQLPTDDADLRRALDVQRLLADEGYHPVPWAALVVAAVAERHQVTVLHHEPIFDHIAKATGQPVQWVAPDSTSDAP
jgi:Predicted nucleic acid-binding protein, contains PIN domain